MDTLSRTKLICYNGHELITYGTLAGDVFFLVFPMEGIWNPNTKLKRKQAVKAIITDATFEAKRKKDWFSRLWRSGVVHVSMQGPTGEYLKNFFSRCLKIKAKWRTWKIRKIHSARCAFGAALCLSPLSSFKKILASCQTSSRCYLTADQIKAIVAEFS